MFFYMEFYCGQHWVGVGVGVGGMHDGNFCYSIFRDGRKLWISRLGGLGIIDQLTNEAHKYIMTLLITFAHMTSSASLTA
jgi:hypothetical protein